MSFAPRRRLPAALVIALVLATAVLPQMAAAEPAAPSALEAPGWVSLRLSANADFTLHLLAEVDGDAAVAGVSFYDYETLTYVGSISGMFVDGGVTVTATAEGYGARARPYNGWAYKFELEAIVFGGGDFLVYVWGAGEIARVDYELRPEPGTVLDVTPLSEGNGAYYSTGDDFRGLGVAATAAFSQVAVQPAATYDLHVAGALIGIILPYPGASSPAMHQEVQLHKPDGTTTSCFCWPRALVGPGALGPGKYVVEREAVGAEPLPQFHMVLLDVELPSHASA